MKLRLVLELFQLYILFLSRMDIVSCLSTDKSGVSSQNWARLQQWNEACSRKRLLRTFHLVLSCFAEMQHEETRASSDRLLTLNAAAQFVQLHNDSDTEEDSMFERFCM